MSTLLLVHKVLWIPIHLKFIMHQAMSDSGDDLVVIPLDYRPNGLKNEKNSNLSLHLE